VKVQVPSPLQASLVHGRPSLQAYAVPLHKLPEHTSFFVQGLPSLHELPVGFGLHEV